MNFIATQYTLANKAFEIYVSGCKGNPHCKNCHNPESWDFKCGNEINNEVINDWLNKVKEFDGLIDNIMIFGGEPNDNDHKELENMLSSLLASRKKIWLFTRYERETLPEFEFTLCDYIKCGRYIPELICDNNIQYGIKLATSNQYIIKKGIDY